MKKIIKNLKNNNGFTLIELMVSVAIFALIMIPLLNAFLTAQNTSRRSHTLGDATLASRNIVETIKAIGAETVVTNGLEGAAFTENDGVFTAELREYRAGLSRFNVRVTLDASEFHCAAFDYAAGRCPDYCSEINCVKVVDYSPMDGIFAQPVGVFDNPDVLAEIYLEDRAVINAIPFISDNIRREITIKADEINNEVRITANYTYTLFGTDLVSPTYSYEFYRGRSTDTEKSMYICYQPFYRGIDTIIIDNTAGVNLKMFVVKQNFVQINYSAVIRQLEPVGTLQGEENTRVFSNFNADPWANGALHIYRDLAGYTVGEITDELVSRSQQNRMFRIEVHVFRFRPGIDFEVDDRPMLRMEAALLD